MKLLSVLNEITNPSTIKDINWYGLLNSGRNVWRDTLQNNVKIPGDLYPAVMKVMVSIGNIKNELERDVMNGQLSQETIDKFNKNLLSSIITVSKDSMVIDTLNQIPPTQRQIAKSIVGKGVIKSSINKSISLTGKSFFIDGMVGQLKKTYNVNSPIVKNYINVLTQMGNSVSNNENLKNSLYNLIIKMI